MRANYLLWVKDEQNAVLLAWNNDTTSWDEMETLTSEKYQFNNGQTDLLIPFNRLGIDAPEQSALKMLAIASNENHLRPWSTMPQTNHVTDQRLLKTAAYTGEAQFFALTHRYEWDHLGEGACPNGKLGPPLANDYLDTNLQLTVTTDPAGTTASYFGDSLFWLWDIILGGGPDKAPPGMAADGPPIPGAHQRPPEGRDNQISHLGDIRANFRDTEHEPVQDGQVIQYTLNYENRGSDTATGVKANISSFFALRLPAGNHLADEKRDNLVLELGDIPAGQTGTAVFTGTVDVATARNEYYTPCLEQYPNFPRGCETAINWAGLDILFYDDAHIQNNQLIEWLWIDHPVDHEAPRFVGLQQPEYIVPLGEVTFSGYAYDPSGIPTIDLELIIGQDRTAITCTDATPHDNQWSCPVDITALNGSERLQNGDLLKVELKATDGAGHQTPNIPAYDFIVDTDAPVTTVTAQGPTVTSDGQSITDDGYTLQGQISDNQNVGAVELCTNLPTLGEENCELVNVDNQSPSYTYDDVPASPRPIGGDRSCEGALWRTFNVTDDFTIGSVQVGLNITHPFRDDIEVELYSPDGERRRIVYGKKHQFNTDQNLDILLSDDAHQPLITQGDDNPAAPYYDRQTRPHQTLDALRGKSSAGEWKLQICDDVPNADEGVYNHARLILIPQHGDTQTSDWRYQVPLTEQTDAVVQTVTITAIDSVGNRSQPQTLDLIIDNVAPVMSVTHVTQQINLADTDKAVNSATINGTASDAGQIASLSLIIRKPNGDTISEVLTLTGDEWAYTLDSPDIGTYNLWVRAIDEAGNATQMGEYEVEVMSLHQIWFPLISN